MSVSIDDNIETSGTIADKLEYLNETKTKIRQAINNDFDLVTNDTTFREYADKIINTQDNYKQYIPTAKASGTNQLTITDSAPINCKKFEIEGNSKQETTKGKNFFPLIPNQTIAGITSTQNEDGTITLNGKATGRADLYCPNADADNYALIENIKPGKYILTGCAEGGSTSNYLLMCVIKRIDGTTNIYTDLGNGENNITINDGDKFRLFIRIIAGVTVKNLVFKPMLRPVNTDDIFEKHTGGQASPNPNFPQEIKNINAIKIKQQGEKPETQNQEYTVDLEGHNLSKWDKLSINDREEMSIVDSTKYDILTGNENNWDSNIFNNNLTDVIAFRMMNFESTELLCSHFKIYDANYLWSANIEGISISTTGKYIAFYIERNKLSSQDITGFKQWLSENNVTIDYPLNESQTIPLGTNKPIKMFEGTNIFTIESNLDTNFSIEYYKKPAVEEETVVNEVNTISEVNEVTNND